jgi:menaquinone-specific isochorismate synthase
MLDRLRLPETVVPRLRHALRSLPPVSGASPISVTLRLPSWNGWIPGYLSPAAPFFYRARRTSGQVLLGLGEALAMSRTGPSRLEELDATLDSLRRGWRHLDPEGTGLEAGALVGFAFDPADPMEEEWVGWPNALLWVPRVLLHCRHEACGVTLTVTPDELAGGEGAFDRWLAPAAPLLDHLLAPPVVRRGQGRARRLDGAGDRSTWLGLVADARDTVAAGALRKVVPTRALALETGRGPDPARLVAELEDRYPQCAVWAIARERGVLVAASPERLVALHGGQVSSDALGGTAPTADPGERAPRMPSLVSAKVHQEHGLVVEAIREALAPLVEGLAEDAVPEVFDLGQLAHLRTVFRGRARPEATLLRLASRLHPTPAVCGLPRRDALDWLRARGNARRGWYTGAVGWVDRRGEGELSVVLRCGLFRGREARLFAGAGVVAASDPEAELAETELKLAGLLEALGGA